MLKEGDLKMLQKIQNNCLKCIKPKQSLSDTNRALWVLPVHKLIKLEQAKLGFKLCNNMLPTRLSEALLTDHMNMSIKKQHKYNTRCKQIPNLPSAHSAQYGKTASCVKRSQPTVTYLWDTSDKMSSQLHCGMQEILAYN